MKLRSRTVGENQGDKIKSSKKIKIQVTSDQSSYSSLILSLPLAILLEIFFRLPINTILNCKFVCKTWFNIITSNPQFCSNYYSSKKSPPFFNTLLLPPHMHTYHTSSYYEFLLLEFSTGHDQHPTTFRTTLKPLRLPGNESLSRNHCELSFIGACNGLICMSISKSSFETVCICNPFTNEYIAMLPKRKILRFDRCMVYYRFGFCPSNNKYKVLRLVDRRDGKGLQGEIFTVGVDFKWRRLPEVFVGSFFCNEWVDPYGGFHWFVPDGQYAISISSFHLRDEKVSQTVPPPGVVLDSGKMELMSLGSRLCLVDNSNAPGNIDIWTLNQNEGVEEESWTKDVVVIRYLLTDSVLRTRYSSIWRSFVPVAKLQNGDILLLYEFGDIVISLNIKDGKCCKVEAHELIKDGPKIAFNPCFLSSEEVGTGGDPSALNARC